MSSAAGDVWFLGIDTSAYTTSLSLIDGQGRLVADERRVLEVEPGRRGLRQSEALFQHVRHLPQLFLRLPRGWGSRIGAVGVSVTPRPVQGSYMPVFLAGRSAAIQVACAASVPVLELSHQEGHIWAGLWSAGTNLPPHPFLALHVSGGTTELVAVEAGEPGRLKVELLGGTTDLSAGQMIDRVGVALGLRFPAGAPLEELAAGGEAGAVRLPVSHREGRLSFSGPTTAAFRALEQGVAPADLAAATLDCVARSVVSLVAWGLERRPSDRLLAVGGVMANGYIRSALESWCTQRGVQCWFALPRYSVDNGVGPAVAAAVYKGAMPLVG